MRWFGLLLAVAGQPVEVDLDGSTHSASGPRLAFDVDGVLRALTLADPARVLTEAAAFLDALPAGARVKCACDRGLRIKRRRRGGRNSGCSGRRGGPPSRRSGI